MKPSLKYAQFDLKTGRVLHLTMLPGVPKAPDSGGYDWLPVTDLELAGVNAGGRLRVRNGLLEAVPALELVIEGCQIAGQQFTISAGEGGNEELEISTYGPGAHRAVMLTGQPRYTLCCDVAGPWQFKIEGPFPYHSGVLTINIDGTAEPHGRGIEYEMVPEGVIYRLRPDATYREREARRAVYANLRTRLEAIKADGHASPAAHIAVLEDVLSDLIDLSR